LLFEDIFDSGFAEEPSASRGGRAVKNIFLFGVHSSLLTHLNEVPRVAIGNEVLPKKLGGQKGWRNNGVISLEIVRMFGMGSASKFVNLASLDIHDE
jgi:hypothetical protein